MITRERRQEMERAICEAIVTAAIANDYAINIDYGEDGMVFPKPITDPEQILHNLGNCDEDLVDFYKDGKWVGQVCLVYGNEGWTVITDYHPSVEPLLAGANKLVDQFAEEDAND